MQDTKQLEVPAQRRGGEVRTVSVEPLTGGARLERVEVVDVIHPQSPESVAAWAQVAVAEEILRANPQWSAPSVVDGEVVTGENTVASWIYSSEAVRRWRIQDVPTALALEPLQRVEQSICGLERDPVAVVTTVLGPDAVGIRTRAKVMAREALEASGRVDGSTRWLSLACGAAIPVLEALGQWRAGGGEAALVLVDNDPRALARARELVVEAGLDERQVEVLEQDLLRGLVMGRSLVKQLGEGSMALVEALGLFEYLPDKVASRLLARAWELVAPGGALVVGNMLDTRPGLEFNQRGAGWPGLHVRSVAQLLELVGDAGLPLSRTTVTIPDDGVYAVLSVRR